MKMINLLTSPHLLKSKECIEELLRRLYGKTKRAKLVTSNVLSEREF